jgi:hypothetical protein
MYLLHRIQKENDSITKGIEIHENLNDAIRSYWGRVKTGFNNPSNPNMSFISVKITDEAGNIIEDYNTTWRKEDAEEANVFFMHHVLKSGETITKDIDVLESQDAANVALAVQMEYGYENPRFQDVSLVYCEITDLLSGGMILYKAAWRKPESEEETEE